MYLCVARNPPTTGAAKELLGYHIIKGAASASGHHGIILAISTTLPYGHYVDHRGTIVRLHTDWLKCILIAGHAPHSGHDLSDIEQWWRTLHERIPKAFIGWPILSPCGCER